MTSKLTPQTARTTEELCALDRDNVDSGDFWCVVSEETVAIGRKSESIELPKEDFDVFIKFYLEG